MWENNGWSYFWSSVWVGQVQRWLRAASATKPRPESIARHRNIRMVFLPEALGRMGVVQREAFGR